MKSPRPSTHSSSSPSFALISVLALVSLAALTATAFLASARLERQATMPLAQTTMLDLALDSGSVAAMRLLDYGAGEQFNHVVTYWRGTNTDDWTNELGYLLIGALEEGNISSKPRQLKYYFCFSSAALTNLGTNLVEYTDRANANDQGRFNRQIGLVLNTAQTGINFAAGQSTNIPLLGDTPTNRFTSPPVGWVYINQDVRVKPGQTNTTNVPVTRFAFYVQDLSSMIDADRMGGFTNGTPFRQSTTLPTNYMQGTNPAEISLTNLSGTALTNATTASNFTSTNNRMKYLSPGMLVLSNGGGLNTNDLRYVTTGLRHWTNAYERIPFGLGYSNCGTTSAGKEKYNLTTGATVADIAAHITSNLSTNFLTRAGGLTNSILYATNDFDYAKCLAANIVDYIDPDSTPTTLDAAQGYRGTEALPYLTELALRYRLEPGSGGYSDYNDSNNLSIITAPTPANRILPSISAYLELWNPYATNIPLSSLGISFKSYGTNLSTSTDAFALGCNQFNRTIDTIAANYINGSSGSLSNLTFTFSDAIAAGMVKGITGSSLSSNAYCVIKLDHDAGWINIGPLSDTNNWRRRNNPLRFEFIYGRTNNTTRRIYAGANLSAFSNACMVVGAPEIGTSYNGYGRSGLCELSVGGIVYDRARNLLMQYSSFETDDDAEYQSWQPSLIIHDPTSFGNRLLSSGDPRITYFLRPTNSSDALFAHLAFSNTSFGGPNTNTQAAHPTKSLSTNSSFLDPSCRLDVTQWPDRGHNPIAYGANPNGANPQTNSANEPIQQTAVSTGSTNSPAFIRNGPMTNVLELGNIYDPILWRRLIDGNITSRSTNDPRFGGGNTLRIGRPEHPRFAWTNISSQDPSIPNMQMSAAALLDLFCLSNRFDEGGKINLNTAPAPVLRALAGGIYLRSDPALLTGGTTGGTNFSIPPAMAEAFAQGVMRFRAQYPFYSPSQLAFISTTNDWSDMEDSWPTNAVFGNTNAIFLVTNSVNTLTSTSLGITGWNDQAAEEWFAKIFKLSTVYSRNFRVYVIAQKATTNSSGAFIGVGPVVRKYYNLLMREAGTDKGDGAGATPIITFQSYY